MKERLPINENIELPSVSEIIGDISDISSRISAIYAKRDIVPGRFLSDEDYIETRRLHKLKDQGIIDLILSNRQLDKSALHIVVRKHPGEKIHPFSMNPVSIYVPSVKISGADYCIRTELSDLRRPEVIEDSLQAESFLDNKKESKQSTVNFVYRTASELIKIRNLKKNILEGTSQSNYLPEDLDDLSSNLIHDRFLSLDLRNEMPYDSTLSFTLLQSSEKKNFLVVTKLIFKNKVYYFPTSGEKLKKIVEETGGFNELITVNS